MVGERVYIGMGSNIGDRRKNIERALFLLSQSGIAIVKRSSCYETAPVGPRQRDFLNAAALCRTSLPPQKLLSMLRSVERRLGRVRRKKWGPRTIDLDILFYGKRRIRTRNLTLPHPRFAERKFVLWPLREIAPHLRPPGHSRTICGLAKKLTDPSQKVKIYRHGQSHRRLAPGDEKTGRKDHGPYRLRRSYRPFPQ
ncbi:MAG: 2-amino-4-hydroxy-6-hydroxymethyldihydropteridine diphosphokinase [Elusimicrobia bacterium RIFCSPLOWO2_01_FULL_60_11]|nr:MAG: 2-amino-4-hydroxy-6-hydroxymethyldihydropteridine diphosphokinase [Elusimicrobia bacterium RIFCSPLOWO2_01_FULL_60_11]